MRMYQAIKVWKRYGGGLICYQCLLNLESGKYSVQSADKFHLPVSDKWKGEMDQQFVELLIEEAPEERMGASFDSIIEAIQYHDLSFHDADAESAGP